MMDPRSQEMAGLFGQFQPQMQRRRQMMPRSSGLFDQYMQSGFMPRYQPPMMQGSPFQSFGGFNAFGAPKMSLLPIPQLQVPQAQIPAWIPSGPTGGDTAGTP